MQFITCDTWAIVRRASRARTGMQLTARSLVAGSELPSMISATLAIVLAPHLRDVPTDWLNSFGLLRLAKADRPLSPTYIFGRLLPAWLEPEGTNY